MPNRSRGVERGTVERERRSTYRWLLWDGSRSDIHPMTSANVPPASIIYAMLLLLLNRVTYCTREK